MGVTKTEIFTTQQNRVAELAKAFAQPARVAILQLLAEKKACIYGDLVDELPLAQATVSQHLKELKKADLIKGEIDGAKSCYCINWEVFEGMIGEFNHLFAGLKRPHESTECC